MDKIIIIVSGFPGAGKTYLSKKLIEKDDRLTYISPDEIKENIYDEYGFNNNEEKEKLILKVWEKYFLKLEEEMKKNTLIVTDYPFSNKQHEKIKKLIEDNDYNPITIRLLADIGVLFKRQRERDKDLSRHLGHLSETYHKGDQAEVRTEENGLLLTYEEFSKRCLERGYDKFLIGELFEYDTTKFYKDEYENFINKIISYIKNEIFASKN